MSSVYELSALMAVPSHEPLCHPCSTAATPTAAAPTTFVSGSSTPSAVSSSGPPCKPPDPPTLGAISHVVPASVSSDPASPPAAPTAAAPMASLSGSSTPTRVPSIGPPLLNPQVDDDDDDDFVDSPLPCSSSDGEGEDDDAVNHWTAGDLSEWSAFQIAIGVGVYPAFPLCCCNHLPAMCLLLYILLMG